MALIRMQGNGSRAVQVLGLATLLLIACELGVLRSRIAPVEVPEVAVVPVPVGGAGFTASTDTTDGPIRRMTSSICGS